MPGSMRPQWPSLEVGQPARVVFRSESDRSYPGKVARLGKETDRETREFIVDVRVLELPQNWASRTTGGSLHRDGPKTIARFDAGQPTCSGGKICWVSLST